MFPVAKGGLTGPYRRKGKVLERKYTKTQLLQSKCYSEPISGRTHGIFNLRFSGNSPSFSGVGQSWQEGQASCMKGLYLHLCTRLWPGTSLTTILTDPAS